VLDNANLAAKIHPEISGQQAQAQFLFMTQLPLFRSFFGHPSEMKQTG